MSKQLSFGDSISFGDAFGGQFGFDNDDLDKQIEAYKQHDNSNQSDYELDAPQSTIGKGLQSEDEYFDNFDSSSFDEQSLPVDDAEDSKKTKDTNENEPDDFDISSSDLDDDNSIPDDIELDSDDTEDGQWDKDESWIDESDNIEKKDSKSQAEKREYIDENSQLSFRDKARLESIVNGSERVTEKDSSIKPEKITDQRDNIENFQGDHQGESGSTQGGRSYGSKNPENSEVDQDSGSDSDPFEDLEKSLDDEDSDEITEIDFTDEDEADQNGNKADPDEDDSWIDEDDSSENDSKASNNSKSSNPDEDDSLDDQIDNIDFGDDDLEDLDDQTEDKKDNQANSPVDVQSLFAGGTVQKSTEPQEDEDDLESLEKDLDSDGQDNDEDGLESLEKDLEDDDEDDLGLEDDSKDSTNQLVSSDDGLESLEKDLEDDDENDLGLDDSKDNSSQSQKELVKPAAAVKPAAVKTKPVSKPAASKQVVSKPVAEHKKPAQKTPVDRHTDKDADRDRRIAEANERAAKLVSEMKANKENKKSDVKIPERKKSITVPQQVHLQRENNVNKNKVKRKLTKQEKYALLTDDRLVQYVEQFLKEHGVQQEAVDRKVLENEFGAQNIQKLIRKSRLILIKNGITMGI